MIIAAIGIYLAGAVAGCVVNKLREQQRQYTHDTQNFEIRMGANALIAFTVGAVLFGVFGMLASRASVSNGYYTWPAFVLASIVCIICGIVCTQKIAVNGDTIRVRKAFKSATYQFSDITGYSADIGGSVNVYHGNNNLFWFDSDMIGARNMLRRLENIPQIDNREVREVVQKKWIITKNGSLKGLLIVFAFLLVFMDMWLVPQGYHEGGIESALSNFGISLLLMVGLSIFVIPLVVGPSYLSVRRMEKTLGIDFDEEMRKLGVTSFNFINEDWYMTEVISFVSVVRRDYVKTIISHKRDSNKNCEVYILQGKDGSKLKLYTNNKEEFIAWLKEGLR